MRSADLQACATDAVDASTIITYCVFTDLAHAVWDETIPREVSELLLDVIAGGRSSASFPDDEFMKDVDSATPDADDNDLVDGIDFAANTADESVIRVGDELLCLLKREVEQNRRLFSKRAHTSDNARAPCPMCPFRAFQRKDRLLEHLNHKHCEGRQYVCSGTKQVKVIAALYDDDRLSGDQLRSQYLARSAALLREHVQPPLPDNHNDIDKQIRLVLSEKGPIYVNVVAVQDVHVYRRVRNIYYTHGFAELFRAEVLVHTARMRAVLPRLTMLAARSGNPLGSLYAGKVECWWPVVEDIFLRVQPC